MSKEPLTQRQNRVYEFIEEYLDRNGMAPTMEEIGDALDISSTNGVFKLLGRLEEKGWIEREKKKARAIQLKGQSQNSFGMGGGDATLPIVSRTHANQPERLRERPEGTLSVDYNLLRKAQDPDACILARAGDDGMTESRIKKGDLLLIEERDWDELENGILVAALVQDQLIAREYEFANRQIHLHPAAPHDSISSAMASKVFQPSRSVSSSIAAGPDSAAASQA